MVDNFNMGDPGAAPQDAAPAPGLRGFINSKNGKLIIGGALLLVLLVAVGSVVLPGLLGGRDTPDQQATVPPAGSVTTTGAAGQESEEASSTLRRAKPLSTFFVFRDIFEPTAKPIAVSTGGSPNTTDTASGDTGGTDEVPDLPADTLFVQSINTVDGRAVGTFFWNDNIYTAGEGERLGETPWRVLSITGDTVSLLYGDSRVTLSVGQALSK